MEFEQSAVGNSAGFGANSNWKFYMDFWAIGNSIGNVSWILDNRQLAIGIVLNFQAIGNSIGNFIWLSRQSAVGNFIWISGDWQLGFI